MWTPTEWDNYHKAQKSVPIASTVIALVFLGFLIATYSLKDTAFLFIFGLLSLLASLASIHVARDTLEEGFCFNNAVEIRGESRQEDSLDSHCVAQGGLLVYTFFACCTTMIAVAVDWRLKKYPSIQEKMENDMGLKAGYYSALVMISLILSIIPLSYSIYHELLGFSRTTPYCFIRSYPFGPDNGDIGIIAIPVCICTGIYLLVFVGHDLCGLLRKTTPPPVAGETDNQTDSAAATNTAYHTAVHVATGVVIFVSLVIFVPYFASKGVIEEKRDVYLNSLHDWTQCVFSNYQVADPNHCFDVCGTHPPTRPSANNVRAQLVSLTGNMIIVGPAYIIAFLITYFMYTPSKYAKLDVTGQPKVELVITSSVTSPRSPDLLLPHGQEDSQVPVATAAPSAPGEEGGQLQVVNEKEMMV
jgi:hypothetical protein